MVFDRQTGAVRPSTPGNEAHIRDFHAVELDSRADANIAEDALAKLEAIFAPVIARVNETRGLPSEIRPLLAFIAMQFVRTPSAREWFRQGHNAIWMATLRASVRDRSTFDATAREAMPGATDADLDETYEAVREFLRQPGARVDMDQTTLVRDAFQLAPDVEDWLAQRCWLLGLAPPDAPAITSDDPIVLEWTGRGKPPSDWYPGIGDPNTVVLVALGPRHILAGVTQQVRGKRRRQLTREDVARFNTRIACRAARFVYFSGATFPFDQNGTIVDGPTDWLKGDDSDPRGGRKRGRVVVQEPDALDLLGPFA